MSSQYGISFIQDNCIQCHGCEVACKSWRSVELGVAWRRVKHIWSGNYPLVNNSSTSVACMHCLDPVCVEACPESAIKKKPENGVVEIDRDKCIGCQTCLEVCPYKVPQFGVDGKMQKCDMCIDTIDLKTDTPPCVRTCPTEALLFVSAVPEEKKSMEAYMLKLI
ncbi:4Fe-4S dicluster domain-containing protein [Thermodesulfobacteriota bacterium]